jgi:ribosomal protein S18 acetylase RimI-like enzyme
MLILQTLDAEDWRVWRHLRLQALEDAPYAFSAILADWQGPGDSEQRWRARLQNVAFNVIAFLDNQPAGMVSATLPDAENQVDLLSLWVAPWARGRGVGDALIAAVRRWAEENKSNRVMVRVYEDNVPAIALYARNGFVDTPLVELSSDGQRREHVMARVLGPSNIAVGHGMVK